MMAPRPGFEPVGLDGAADVPYGFRPMSVRRLSAVSQHQHVLATTTVKRPNPKRG